MNACVAQVLTPNHILQSWPTFNTFEVPDMAQSGGYPQEALGTHQDTGRLWTLPYSDWKSSMAQNAEEEKEWNRIDMRLKQHIPTAFQISSLLASYEINAGRMALFCLFEGQVIQTLINLQSIVMTIIILCLNTKIVPKSLNKSLSFF